VRWEYEKGGKMTADELLIERDGVITRVILNRPESLNSANSSMLNGLTRAVERAGRDPETRVVVISGAGRAFCSGADIGGGKQSGNGGGGAQDNDTLSAANQAVLALRAVDKPVVAAVNGLAAGVGASLAMACDLVVASTSAYFLLAFTKIGLIPDGGATALIPAAIGRARALRMALLAERISAEQAAEWGMISHVVGDECFEKEVAAVVDVLAGGAPLAFVETKRAINAATLDQLTAAIDRETRSQTMLSRSEDFREGVKAFQQKRRPQFRGA
jgi:enoyl-CoA hydratase